MKPIYVEILIHGSMEDVWSKSQSPQLHQQWDLRFTCIEYLPRSDNSKPQRFLYRTRIGFGIEVVGEGETVGEAFSESIRTSALRFWSDDWKSLIREGSGYWKYIAEKNGIRFLTSYDYTTRFGLAGQIFDFLLFRPLLGWSTAWSFDRLRLWIEKNFLPATTLLLTLIHAIANITIAIIWIYHGLVPKILFRHPDELRMLVQTGISSENSEFVLLLVGFSEILFGILLLAANRTSALLQLNILLMVVAAVIVAVCSPEYLIAPFNAISLNLASIALSIVGLFSESEIASSRTCLRKPYRP